MSSSKESMVNIPAQYGAVISSNTIEENESTNFFARPSLDQMTFKGKRTSAALLGGVLAVSGCAAWFGHAGTHLQQSVGSSYSSLGSTTSSSGFTSFSGQRTIPANFIATKPNLVYLKVPKTGSSTMSDIARRMASQHGLSNVDSMDWIASEPGVWWWHAPYHELREHIESLTRPYFAWATIRDPVERVISHFQYFVMLNKCTLQTGYTCPEQMPTQTDDIEKLLLDYVERAQPPRLNYQLEYTSVDGDPNATFRELQDNKKINLDFVGVTERFTESVLVMGEMLGLSLSDMLYVPVNSQDYGWGGPKELSITTHNKLTELFKTSQDWKYLEAANRRLDGYILKIDNFSNKLHEYEYHLKIAQSRCAGDDNVPQCLTVYANTVTLQSWMPDASMFFPALDHESMFSILPRDD